MWGLGGEDKYRYICIYVHHAPLYDTYYHSTHHERPAVAVEEATREEGGALRRGGEGCQGPAGGQQEGLALWCFIWVAYGDMCFWGLGTGPVVFVWVVNGGGRGYGVLGVRDRHVYFVYKIVWVLKKLCDISTCTPLAVALGGSRGQRWMMLPLRSGRAWAATAWRGRGPSLCTLL